MQDDAETLPAETPDGDLDDVAERDAGADDDLTGDWLSGLDDDSAEFVRTKGWEDLDAVVRSYQNLESMLGSDRAGRTLTLPKDEDDAEAYAEIYDRLGRPEAASGYALEVPDGMAIDEPMMDWYREAAHAAGLSARQASALFDAWNGMAVQRVAAMNQDKQAAQDQGIEALREKWGGAFDRKVAAARQAARRFGGGQSAALEEALGRAGVTGAAPIIFRDNISVPTIPALARARLHLDKLGRKDVTLVITGGLRKPADFRQGAGTGGGCHRRIQRRDAGDRLHRHARVPHQQLPGRHRHPKAAPGLAPRGREVGASAQELLRSLRRPDEDPRARLRPQPLVGVHDR